MLMVDRLDLAINRMTNAFSNRLTVKFDRSLPPQPPSTIEKPNTRQLEQLDSVADSAGESESFQADHRREPFYRRVARVFGWR